MIMSYFTTFLISDPNFISLEFTNWSLLFSVSNKIPLEEITQRRLEFPGGVAREKVNEVFRWILVKHGFVYCKIGH